MSEASVVIPEHARPEPVPDAIGRLLEFWGFKRTMGRIWGVLYLSPRPVSPGELCERLDISPASASMTLAELESWGVVRRLSRIGERRSFFLAETSPWKLVSRLIVERELRGIDQFIAALESAIAEHDSSLEESGRDSDSRYSIQRVSGLLRLAQMGRRLFGAFVQGRKTDLDSIDTPVEVTPVVLSVETPQIPRVVRG